MFKKVLIAEDFDSYNLAVNEALKSLSITDVSHALYCDEALVKIKRAMQEGAPFDLLVSDISFKPDAKKVAIENGIQLVAQARALQPNLKVIVFSIETRLHPLQYLLDTLQIDGYVLKGRNNVPELKWAIQNAYVGGRYISDEISHVIRNRSLEDIEDYDITLLDLLASGISQSEMSGVLQKRSINPSSVSSIEKRLNRLKATLGAANNVQLIVIAKDLGLI
jgi:two-component system capsular synthesis response regulator RcsB